MTPLRCTYWLVRSLCTCPSLGHSATTRTRTWTTNHNPQPSTQISLKLQPPTFQLIWNPISLQNRARPARARIRQVSLTSGLPRALLKTHSADSPAPSLSHNPSPPAGRINSPAPDLLPYLHALASSSPSQFGQAKEYFRRAAELEAEQDLQGRGEGKRWLELVRTRPRSRQDHPTWAYVSPDQQFSFNRLCWLGAASGLGQDLCHLDIGWWPGPFSFPTGAACCSGPPCGSVQPSFFSVSLSVLCCCHHYHPLGPALAGPLCTTSAWLNLHLHIDRFESPT